MYLGYLKYYGNKVDDGLLDAKKAADALLGFDEVLRYFIYQEDSSLQSIDFELPVKIEKGSWFAYIPDTIQDWVVAGGAIAATTYLTTAAKKMAENDFKTVGFSTIIKKAFESICWVVKLSAHINTTNKESFKGIKYKNNNTEIGITNENGQVLYVPYYILETYKKCPDELFSRLARVIDEGRELEIGRVDADIKANISYSQRNIFYVEHEDTEQITLPELIHGEKVELLGHTIRGNEKTNTIGFLYEGHVLTCKPKKGSIVSQKFKLFDNCKIIGVVERLDKQGNYKEKKPRIIFTKLLKVETAEPQRRLFG